MFSSIERSARSRLSELDALYRDLAEMRPTDRDEALDDLIVQREREIACVLDIIGKCNWARGRVTERPRTLDGLDV